MTTSVDVVNRALELIGSQTQITGLNDGSPAGNAAGVLYAPAVNLLLRQLDPGFARRTAALVAAAGTTPPPWSYEYTYPADCLRLRQVRPAPGYNVNDPQPVRAQVAFDNGLSAKVIVCNQASAYAVYTSSAPVEAQWDAAFIEAVARRLANPLAMALAGRPDFARELLAESAQFAALADSIEG